LIVSFCNLITSKHTVRQKNKTTNGSYGCCACCPVWPTCESRSDFVFVHLCLTEYRWMSPHIYCCGGASAVLCLCCASLRQSLEQNVLYLLLTRNCTQIMEQHLTRYNILFCKIFVRLSFVFYEEKSILSICLQFKEHFERHSLEQQFRVG